MKKVSLAAFVAVLFCLLAISPRAFAGPVNPINSGGNFAVSSVVEVSGTNPPVIYLYGGSSRAPDTAVSEFGVLTSLDGFATNPTWQPLTGVVGYTPTQVNNAIVMCPAGKTCGGYKAFYILDSGTPTLYRCIGLTSATDLNGCALWSVPGMTAYTTLGIGLDNSGNKLLVGGYKSGDTKSQIYSIDIAGSAATKLSACSDPTHDTYVTGSVAGDGGNQYLYINYDYSDHYRFSWNGSNCTGGKTKVNGAMGWNNLVNDVSDTNDYGAVGQFTGTFYLSLSDYTLKFSKKDALCNDSFISLGSSETCDAANTGHPLNDQTCLTLGFTGGTLGCNASTCGWDTSLCTSPAVCGNNLKEGPEACDGSDFGGKNCVTEMGAGWGGTLSCTGGCTTIDTSACTPPTHVCGNGMKEGTEACDAPDFGGKSCATEMGAGWTGTLTCTSCMTIGTGSCSPPAPVCGNGVLEGAEVCDSSNFGGKSCATEKGAGWTGTLTCNSCTSIGTGSCNPPAPTCGDGTCNGSETCSSCPSDCGVCCGNGTIDSGEQCDGSTMGGASCSSVLGGGYSGSLTCKSNCTFESSACIPPATCGNGDLDDGEQCDGINLNGKTCASEMGAGWSGTLSCSACTVVTSACKFDWGFKNLVGECSVGMTGAGGASQQVNFSGGECSADYCPIGAETCSKLNWIAEAGKVLAVTVMPAGATTNVATPQGVSHKEVVDNGNKYQANAGATGLGVEGTTYSEVEKSYPIIAYECADGAIRLKFNSSYISAINVDGTPGRLPAGYGAEVNVLTGIVTKGPYKIGSSGDGGAGGSGSGGDAGSTSDGGTGGNDAGVTGSGGGGSDDDGGCSCAVPGKDGFNSGLILGLALLALTVIRRRSKS